MDNLNLVPPKMSSLWYNLPWMTQPLQRHILRKKHLYNKAKRSHKASAWQRYKDAKKAVTSGLHKARDEFINNSIASAFEEGDNKHFWKYVRALCRDNTGIAPLKQCGLLHSSGPTKAHILNKQFGSVFAPPDDEDIPVLPGPSFPNIGELIINVQGVTTLLLNVKPNKPTGPDNIPCCLPKEAAHEISPVLTDIFTSSLLSGSLPNDWKLALVAPAFKKGNTNEPANYCPKSLMCVYSKLLGHIICHHIREHLDNPGESREPRDHVCTLVAMPVQSQSD